MSTQDKFKSQEARETALSNERKAAAQRAMKARRASQAKAKKLKNLANPDNPKYHGGKKVDTSKYSTPKSTPEYPGQGRRNLSTRPGKGGWNNHRQSKDSLDRPVRTKKNVGKQFSDRRVNPRAASDPNLKHLRGSKFPETPKNPSYKAPKYNPNVKFEKVPYNPSPGRGGMIKPGGTIKVKFPGAAQKPAPGSHINKDAIKASIKATATTAKNAVRSNAGLVARGRQALNSGVAAVGRAAMNTLPGRGVARIAGAVGKTAAGKVAGAVLSKTAVPLMVAGAVVDVARTAAAGYGAYAAGQHQRRTEAHTKEKYGSVDAATRTRHANDRKRAREQRKTDNSEKPKKGKVAR